LLNPNPKRKPSSTSHLRRSNSRAPEPGGTRPEADRSPRVERSAAAGSHNGAHKEANMADRNINDDNGVALTEDDVEEFLSTRFMTASALGNRKLQLTIAEARKQEIRSNRGGTETKPVLAFLDSPQRLPLNKTNLRELRKMLGKPAAWAGAVISIFADEDKQYEGKPSLCVKVIKVPAKRPGPNGPGLDDQIPF
jgi:hypothetical protein